MNTNAKIYLNGCSTGVDDNNSGSFSAQRFADHFGVDTRGMTEGVSFGLPIPHFWDEDFTYTDLAPGYMRGEGGIDAPVTMWAKPRSSPNK